MLTMNKTPDSSQEPEFISDEEISRILDIPLETIRRLLRKRVMPNIKIGKGRRVRKVDFDEYLRKQLEGEK